ncbi:MAG: hypothetical protein HYX43_04665 [Burkholderiales bacterium]|nr:hypothetical protein [Burkholderiales bacterium]
MSLADSISNREVALLASLRELQDGIDDATGKGTATENLIEEVLLAPYFPTGFACCKGSVIDGANPSVQSPAIDRVVYDQRNASPLLFKKEHSIFPIEAVAGVIENTMRLDATKLRRDVERARVVRDMRERMVDVPIPGSTTKIFRAPLKTIGCRVYLIGLPADPNWGIKTIGACLIDAQRDLNNHVHGLYVPGIAFFATNTEPPADGTHKVVVYGGNDRLFRCISAMRSAWDRWRSGEEMTSSVEHYLPSSRRWLDEL